MIDDFNTTRVLMGEQIDDENLRNRVLAAVDRSIGFLELVNLLPGSTTVSAMLADSMVLSTGGLSTYMRDLRQRLVGEQSGMDTTLRQMDEEVGSAVTQLREEARAFDDERKGLPDASLGGQVIGWTDELGRYRRGLEALSSEMDKAQRERLYRDEIESLRAEAATAAEDATRSAKLAAKAAGQTGSSAEAKALSEYANKQLRAAEFFRWLAVALLVATVTLAILLPHPSPGEAVEVVYRIAILAGSAGIATYLARQSGMHRRNGNWATALRVQLLTFPALADSVGDDETRHRILESFAQRLLHSAPEHGKPQADDSASTQLLLETILRRLP